MTDKVGPVAQVWIRIKWVCVGIVFLVFIGALYGSFTFVFPSSKPPKERKLIENFYTHRTAYERLRDMLLEDKQLLRVANWGVETTKSGARRVTPGGTFPVNRYNEYLTLLSQIGAKGASRARGEPPEFVGVLVWATGWGGDTRHIQICWIDHQPSNQVASLDDYYQTPRPRPSVVKRIDGNWYLAADW